tara:strand:+ start:292 stop:495 length:204 start_codon:yes stop_codon:yes gene_type:complete
MTDLFGKDGRAENGLKELRREKAMRDRVYFHWVSTGRMTQAVADRQMQGLNDAISVIEEMMEEDDHG